MKYIISESRLEDLVISFIDDNVRGLEHHVSDDIPNSSFGEKTWWWGIDDEELFIANFDPFTTIVGIRLHLFNLVQNMFSISHDETFEYFGKWIKQRLGIEFKELYLF